MDTPDSQHITESETEVEIIDLDASPGTAPARFPVRRFSFRVRVGIGIAILAAMALLGALVLRSVLSPPEAAIENLPPQIHYSLTMTVVDGIGYASTADGIVSAFRISNGTLLWHHTLRNVGEEAITVVDGVVYLVPNSPYSNTATTVTLEALRTHDGSLLWSRTITWDAITPLQLTVANGLVYIRTAANAIEVLRAANGSLLWHYTTPALTPFFSTVANSMVYVLTAKGQLSALQAITGLRAWTYNSSVSSQAALSPLVTDGEVFLSLQGGGMDVLRANTGALLWRYRPHLPALALYPLPLVANGVVYALTQDGHLLALRESTGSPIWSTALHISNLLPLLSVTNGVIYMEAFGGSNVEALRASTCSVLWSYHDRAGGLQAVLATQTAVYLAFSGGPGFDPIGKITALRASDAAVLWNYRPQVPATQLMTELNGSLMLIVLQDGNVTTLNASSGSVRWHRYVDG